VRWVRLRGVVTAASPVRAPTPNESVLSQTGPFMHTALPAELLHSNVFMCVTGPFYHVGTLPRALQPSPPNVCTTVLGGVGELTRSVN
jgi:hypothetical protein